MGFPLLMTTVISTARNRRRTSVYLPWFGIGPLLRGGGGGPAIPRSGGRICLTAVIRAPLKGMPRNYGMNYLEFNIYVSII